MFWGWGLLCPAALLWPHVMRTVCWRDRSQTPSEATWLLPWEPSGGPATGPGGQVEKQSAASQTPTHDNLWETGTVADPLRPRSVFRNLCEPRWENPMRPEWKRMSVTKIMWKTRLVDGFKEATEMHRSGNVPRWKNAFHLFICSGETLLSMHIIFYKL